MPDEQNVISELRAATAETHRALEDAIDILSALADPARRRAMVARYHAFYLGADRALARWPGACGEAGPPGRARFGAETRAEAEPPVATPAPSLADPAEAMGFLYVVEGSALGGRTILKQLDRRGIDVAGLGFLDPRPGGAGAAWRGLLARLDLEIGADAAKLKRAIVGAHKGFAFARACLREGAREPEPGGN